MVFLRLRGSLVVLDILRGVFLPKAQLKPLLGAIIPPGLLGMLGGILALLRLRSPFLLGPFMKCRGDILQGTDQMDSQIPFRFVGCLNRLCHTLHRTGKMFKRGLDSFQARGDITQKLLLFVWTI